MNTKITKAFALIFLGVALTGCSNSEIHTTKAATVPQDSTYTYETALSNRGSCEKDEWNATKDETERMVVEYHCILKDGPKLLAILRQQKISEIKRDYEGYYRGLDQSIEDTQKAPESWKKLSAEASEKLAQAQANQTQDNARVRNEDPVQALRRAAVQSEMGAAASARFSAEQAQQHLTDAKENLDKNLASLRQERARFEQKEKGALAQIDNTYDGIVKASEVFRWFVNDKGVVPVSAGVELEKRDGSVIHLNKDWKLTMRNVIQYRGDDHVRYVLDVPDHIVLSQ